MSDQALPNLPAAHVLAEFDHAGWAICVVDMEGVRRVSAWRMLGEHYVCHDVPMPHASRAMVKTWADGLSTVPPEGPPWFARFPHVAPQAEVVLRSACESTAKAVKSTRSGVAGNSPRTLANQTSQESNMVIQDMPRARDGVNAVQGALL